MRTFLLSIFFLISLLAKSVTYYVSPTGNDNNVGTSISTPWKTIDKVNTKRYTFLPGDQILFERNGTYRGSLLIGSSGAAGNPIVISSYGTGNNPKFLGSTAVTNWTLHSGNIWKAQVPNASVSHLFSNGNLMTLARFPNVGWLRNDVGSATQINDNQLTQPSGYWNGSTIVVRTTGWSYDTSFVTNYVPGTVNFTSFVYGYNIGNYEWGYFFQNKFAELDSQNEWYYNKATSTLYFWAPGGVNPNTLSIDAITSFSVGFTSEWLRNYITIDGIDFSHYGQYGVSIIAGDYVTIQNCKFDFCANGLNVYGDYCSLLSNTITHTFRTSIFVVSGPDGGSNNLVQGNTLTDCSIYPGLGESSWGYFGIRVTGPNNVIRYNRLTNIGYIGIQGGTNCLIEKNFVQGACSILNDGSGIALDETNGSIVRDNIVLSTIGNVESCAPDWNGCEPKGKGIYFGNLYITNTAVDGNTVAYCLGPGIWNDHTMSSVGNSITNNNLFGNDLYQLGFSDFSNGGPGPAATPPYAVPVYNDIITGNVMYCSNASQKTMYHINGWYSGVDFGTFNNNYYFNPWDLTNIRVWNIPGAATYNYTLPQWKAVRGDDPLSVAGPLNTSSPASDHRLFYNDQLSTQTIVIPTGVWSDVYGNIYTGSVQIDSFKSKILYKVSGATFIMAKVYLDGPMDWSLLRMKKGLVVPTTNPYTSLGITNTSDILTISQDSIVDWVLLQLVDNQNQVVESKSFLVKMNGQIITPSGSNQLIFTQNPIGKKLLIRHRNHLGVITSQSIQSSGQLIDFTLASTQLYGNEPTLINGTHRSLWLGDVNFNNNIKYTGTSNDRDPILISVGGTTPTNTVSGYFQEDINLDGIVKYTGLDNDRDPILVTIGGIITTNVRNAQLP